MPFSRNLIDGFVEIGDKFSIMLKGKCRAFIWRGKWMINWKIRSDEWMGEKTLEISSKNTMDDDVIGRRDAMTTTDDQVAGAVVLVDKHAGEIIDG